MYTTWLGADGFDKISDLTNLACNWSTIGSDNDSLTNANDNCGDCQQPACEQVCG
ncbi:MAG: hypothetical protein GY868_11165 [Deltaproteobacteria bacterium]|nr:hypothetical protein [Deltaproteobacteria bacterium]